MAIRVGGRSHGLPLLLPVLTLLAVVLSLRAPGAAAASSSSPGHLVFHVGGPRGWRVPDAGTNYGWWAMNNRFRVGDDLYFKYANDSVLVVNRAAFDACNATEPVAAFVDGATTFRLDRPGFFCFISGEPGHCEEGQRLVIRVMVHPAADAPGPAQGPATAVPPGHGGSAGSGGRPWQSGPPGSAATVASAAGVAVAAAVVLVSLVLMFQ